MKRVIIASRNPVKIAAVIKGFKRVFPDDEFEFEEASVPSGVPEQPGCDAETRAGARNRAGNARLLEPHADFWIGIEGGIQEEGGGMHSFAWIVIENANHRGEARTTTFPLPPRVIQLVRSGMELGDANDQVFGKVNSKQDNGAVGLLSSNTITRTMLYEQAVCLALIPLFQPELYPPGEY